MSSSRYIGQVCVFSNRRGVLLASWLLPVTDGVTSVRISADGSSVIFCSTFHSCAYSLHVYTMCGRLICALPTFVQPDRCVDVPGERCILMANALGLSMIGARTGTGRGWFRVRHWCQRGQQTGGAPKARPRSLQLLPDGGLVLLLHDHADSESDSESRAWVQVYAALELRLAWLGEVHRQARCCTLAVA